MEEIHCTNFVGNTFYEGRHGFQWNKVEGTKHPLNITINQPSIDDNYEVSYHNTGHHESETFTIIKCLVIILWEEIYHKAKGTTQDNGMLIDTRWHNREQFVSVCNDNNTQEKYYCKV